MSATGTGELTVTGHTLAGEGLATAGQGSLTLAGLVLAAVGALTPAGTGALTVTAALTGQAAVQVSGPAALTVAVTASGAGGHGPAGTGALEVSGIAALGGDWPVAAGALRFAATASGGGYVGAAIAGRWLYIHTDPPAQVYADPALRGRMLPAVPTHRAGWSASPLRAQIGRVNDAWELSIDSPGTLAARLIEQAPHGVQIDVMDGGRRVRSGVSTGLRWSPDGSIEIDVEADTWTRALPLRTIADLGVLDSGAQPIAWRYGRAVRGAALPLNADRTRWVWADHACAAVREVRIGSLPAQSWDWRVETDQTGAAVTIIETLPVETGASVVAVGDGAIDPMAGTLMTSPADIAWHICQRAGLDLARGDFAALRAECLARSLEVAGTIDGGTLQAAIARIADSIYAAFARERAGLLRLLPATTADGALPSRVVLGASAAEVQATRLRVMYAIADGKPLSAVTVTAPAIERRHAVSTQDVTLPMIASDRAARDVATRMLSDLSRPAYAIRCGQVTERWAPGAALSVDLPIGAGVGLVTASEIDDDSSRPTVTLRIGAAPTITVGEVASQLEPVEYTGGTVQTQGDQRVVTITDPAGAPIAGASCTLDGSIARTTDSAGRVAFPASLMTPGTHTVEVKAAGFQPFTLTLVVA